MARTGLTFPDWRTRARTPAALRLPTTDRPVAATTISRTWLEADHRVVLAKATTDPASTGTCA